MRLSPTPDLGAPWKMALVALGVTLVAATILVGRDTGSMAYGLGDTDDALRMVLARGLLQGQGWFDQLVTRLQPPQGLQSHWSRLIDGGIAGLIALFRLVMPDARAEMTARIVWPMLWIAPAALASLANARRLGGGAAVFACAILLMTELSLYLQFRPGRIDHHGIQIMLCVVAVAGAGWGSVRGAALSGAAIGLGLAIGLEAMIFEIAIGAFFPLCFLFMRDEAGRQLRAFALALGVSTLGFFLIQTPPWRWAVSACDALAANLVGGVLVGAVGLVAMVALTASRDWRWRLGALLAVGAAAAGTYLALNPHCLAGPFADVDPRIKSFWLQYVQEIRPIPRTWARDHATVYSLMAPCLFGAVAWLWLGRDRARRLDPFWILSGVVLTLAIVTGFSAIRMATYANWIAIPIVAAAVTDLVARYARGAMLVLAVTACAATPVFAGQGAAEIDKKIAALRKPAPKAAVKPAPKPAAKTPARPVAGVRGDRCFQSAAYQALARQPAGLVLAEIDLGPFVLAYTPSSAMAAPYHRMSWGMLSARGVMEAEAEAAQAKARALGVAYVLACPGHVRNADRVGMKADALQKRLDRNQPPSWLEPIPTNGTLRLYRVKPAA